MTSLILFQKKLLYILFLNCFFIGGMIGCEKKQEFQVHNTTQGTESERQKQNEQLQNDILLQDIDPQKNRMMKENQETLYSDEEVKQYLEELKQWYEENLIGNLNTDNDNFHTRLYIQTHMKICYILLKTDSLLKMNRSDIAITEVEKDRLQDEQLDRFYIMIRGLIFLDSAHFDDALNAFNQSLQGNTNPYVDESIIKIGCYFGLIFTYIGLNNRESAYELFIKLSKEDREDEEDNMFNALKSYFSYPVGLYQLSRYVPHNQKNIETSEDEKYLYLSVQFPCNYHFKLDMKYAEEHNININNYPQYLPPNISENDCQTDMK